MSKLDRIRALYAEIPRIECQGLCSECCGPILMSSPERDLLNANGFNGHDAKTKTCSLLGLNLRCQAYEARPAICRLWGVIDDLKCPFGCQPEPGYLTREQAHALWQRIIKIAEGPGK